MRRPWRDLVTARLRWLGYPRAMTIGKAIRATEGTWNRNKPGRITHFVVYGDAVWGANPWAAGTLRDVAGRVWLIGNPTTYLTPRGEEVPAVEVALSS